MLLDKQNQVFKSLSDVEKRITSSAKKAGRVGDEINLVAVSKAHNSEVISAALKAGHRRFGENRVQETKLKWPKLIELYPDTQLHLIGSLQSNKATDAVAIFDVIETLDRPKLAKAIAKAMDVSGRRPRCLREGELAKEEQKGGIFIDQLSDFLRLCKDDLSIPIVGLMCIPPFSLDPSPYFALLRKLALRYELSQISMGMSEDFETAITFGATEVRVGSAIFGTRELEKNII